MDNLDFIHTMRSQIEISLWELFPGLILLAFIFLGVYQVWLLKREERNRRKGQDRKKMHLPITIKTPVTDHLKVNTFNISMNGAFLDYEDLKKNETFLHLIGKDTGIKVGDLMDIEIPLGRFRQITCQARLIRYNFSDYELPPKGVAVKFVQLNENQKKNLASLISLKNESSAA